MDVLSVDHEIQQALVAGDVRRASRALVIHHADAVHAMCRALVRDRTLAEDLCQEAFAKAIAALPTFRGEAQSRTWLLSIARNLCIDHLRRQKGPIDERVELDTEVHPSEAPAVFEVLVRRGDVEVALQILSETERAIVVLHHAHGVGYPELAGSLGIAEGALRMRMSRALQKMREAIEATELRSLGAPMAQSAGAPSPVPRKALDSFEESAAPPAKSGGLFERARRLWPRHADAPATPPPVPSSPAPVAAPRAPQIRGAVPSSVAPPASLWAMPAALRDRILASF